MRGSEETWGSPRGRRHVAPLRREGWSSTYVTGFSSEWGFTVHVLMQCHMLLYLQE